MCSSDLRLAVKPTPTISVAQDSVNVDTLKEEALSPITRRDATILPRIYPVCEAMIRIAILDAILMAKGYRAIIDIDEKWDNI